MRCPYNLVLKTKWEAVVTVAALNWSSGQVSTDLGIKGNGPDISEQVCASQCLKAPISMIVKIAIYLRD